MAFALSNWGPQNSSWLEHGVCEGSCDRVNTLSAFSNLRFNTAGAIDPDDPDVDESIYKYGNKCNADRHDLSTCDTCGDDSCHISWVFGDADKWRSDEAQCRCLPKQRAPQGYTYGRRQCKRNTWGTCNGCDDCRWSWPSDDTAKGGSAEALCRCKPEEQDITFGGQCGALFAGECGAECTSCQWSWPTSDPAKWKSEDAACRCPASAISDVVYGGMCDL